jgi:hypothetical protein
MMTVSLERVSSFRHRLQHKKLRRRPSLDVYFNEVFECKIKLKYAASPRRILATHYYIVCTPLCDHEKDAAAAAAAASFGTHECPNVYFGESAILGVTTYPYSG